MPVTSPTFVVGHAYEGSTGPVSHLDLYRLAGMGDEDPGLLDPFFAPDAIAFVEWPEQGPGAWPEERVTHRVRLAHAGGDERTIEVAMILGIDTATPSTAVALSTGVERRHDPAPGERPGHAAQLLVLVEAVLADVGWEAVTRIAVGVGPGGFTGLRIGISTARALAQARDLPLVGVSEPGGAHGRGRGSCGVRRHRRSAGRGVRGLAGPASSPWRWRRRRWPRGSSPASMAVGDGAVRFREQLERAGAFVPVDDSPLHRVSALQVCRLGAHGEPADRDALLPDYRREPDAKPRQQP